MANRIFPIGYNDAPIETPNEDAFNVEQYVNGIARFIRDCATPMTISIQGDWGSGKTSIMNMINRALVSDSNSDLRGRSLNNEQIQTVWFNTWQYSQFNCEDNLAISMITHLMKKLNPGKRGSEIFKGVKLIFMAGVTTLSDYALGERATDGIQNGSQKFADSLVDIADEFQKLKDSFSDSVKKLGKRVVIFIDDLDRLRPEKAVELLEVLKLFLDCENCVFVLAIDYEVVTSGISAKYGGNVGKEKGRSFFDKIIQLPFKVPVNNYDIKNYVNTMLGRMDIDTTRPECFADLIRRSIGYNPRAMKRLFNSFKLLDIIMEGDTGENPFDSVEERQRYLFATIAMQMGFDELYQFVNNAITAPNIDNSATAKLMTDLTDRIALGTAPEYAPLVELLESDEENNVERELDRISQFMVYFFATIQEERQPDINLFIPDHEESDVQQNVKIVNPKRFGNDISQSDAKPADDYDRELRADDAEDSEELSPNSGTKQISDDIDIGNGNMKIKVKNDNQLDITIGESDIQKLRSCFKRSAITSVTTESGQTDDTMAEWQHNRRIVTRACDALNRMKFGGKKYTFVQNPPENKPFSPRNTKISGFAELKTKDGLVYTLGFTLDSVLGEPRKCWLTVIADDKKNRSLLPEIFSENCGKLMNSRLAEAATFDIPNEHRIAFTVPISIGGQNDDGIVNRIVGTIRSAFEKASEI